MEAVHARNLEEWASLGSRSFVPLRVAGDEPFSGMMAHVPLGRVGVCYVRSAPSVVWRGPSEIARDPREDVLLSLQLSGSAVVSQEGRTTRLGPSTACIYEADRPYDLRFDEAMSELVLQVPRSLLGLTDAAIRGSTARLMDVRATPLIVLQGLLEGIAKAGPRGDLPHDIGATATNLLATTLHGQLGERRQEGLTGESVYHSARSFIDGNYADSSMTIDAIARHHRVSRRYVEAQFARHDQTPAGYLREVRLTEARRLLSWQPGATIASVAHRVGFADANTFIRAFRRRMGQTPDAWRRATRAQQQPAGPRPGDHAAQG